MELKDLSPELQEKAKTCKTPEEVLELAKSEGVSLSDEDLEQVSGGWGSDDEPQTGGATGTWKEREIVCPRCGHVQTTGSQGREVPCLNCGAPIRL